MYLYIYIYTFCGLGLELIFLFLILIVNMNFGNICHMMFWDLVLLPVVFLCFELNFLKIS